MDVRDWEEKDTWPWSRRRDFATGNNQQVMFLNLPATTFRFGELFRNWKLDGFTVSSLACFDHQICKGSFCLWSKE